MSQQKPVKEWSDEAFVRLMKDLIVGKKQPQKESS